MVFKAGHHCPQILHPAEKKAELDETQIKDINLNGDIGKSCLLNCFRKVLLIQDIWKKHYEKAKLFTWSARSPAKNPLPNLLEMKDLYQCESNQMWSQSA